MRAFRRLSAPAVAIMAVALMSGCSSPEATPEASAGTTTTPAAGLVAPVVVALDDELAGTTVTVGLDSAVDLTADDPAAWSGDVSDERILEFIPGGDTGGASFNPGIKPLVAGTSEVSLTDGETTIEFTVEVTE